MAEFTSKGVAGSGLGLGIAGSTLGSPKLWRNTKMINAKWEDNVFIMAKHKLLEVIEKLNKEEHISAENVIEYKNAIKALYYLLSTEKSK